MGILLIKDVYFKNGICEIYGKMSNDDCGFRLWEFDTIKNELDLLKAYAGGEFEDIIGYKSIFTKYLESIKIDKNEYSNKLINEDGKLTYYQLLFSKININDFNNLKNKGKI